MSDITDNRGSVDNTDSPITKKLLNLPGQSVDTKLQDFAADHFLVPLMIVGMLLIVCATEWIGYFSNAPRNPWGYSAMLVVTVAVFAARWRRNWAQLKALKLGREGERAMAEYMNTRLDPTARAFHDGIPSTPCEASDRLDTAISTSGVRTDSLLSDTPIALSHQHFRCMDFALPQRNR
jgi:hypothetical protein